jgi:hypothetical protein
MDIHTPWVRLTDFDRSRGNRPLRPRRHHGFRPRSGLLKGVGDQFHGRFQAPKAHLSYKVQANQIPNRPHGKKIDRVVY